VSDEALRDLINFRLEQAKETLREAEVLLEAEAWRGAINRAYYAMFYGALAALATGQFGSSKHTGVIALFDREYVRPGTLPRSLSRSLHVAFDLRQTHDYGETNAPDEETAGSLVSEARAFILAIDTYLHEQGTV